MSKYIALPKGVSEANFDKAIAEFKKILGAENVLTSAEHLAPYRKTMMPVADDAHAPSAALVATEVAQVQKIVAVCNKYKVPVWTISTGKNLGYGSAAPGERGQVVLDLKRMNKIIEVNAELGYALVEPGVTYQQLYDYIQEKKLPLWMSCPAPSAIAGPLGNTVDRGVGYTPYGEHFLFSCGMEVVLATGEVLRTGMGGIENSNTWQVFKWGYGPYLDGLFTQSNYGIVTKLGIWLMPAPPAYKPFCIRFPDETDIADIVDTIRPLRISMIIPNAIVIASTIWEAAVTVKRKEVYKGTGQIPTEVLREVAKKANLGAWNVYAALYGSPDQIEVNWNIVKAFFSKHKKAEILTEKELGNDPVFQYRAALMQGKPTLTEFGLYNWRGGGGSIWFSPVSQAMGSETMKQMDMAKRIMGKHGLDYVGEFIVGWRDMHHIIDVLFDKTKPEEVAAAHACFTELLAEFSKAGYGTYRTNTAFMDKVADTYGPVQRKVFQRLKRALDPNGILAPGKSGIR
jgi:4-cresol dehydrogenase (hydroxylating)